MYRDHATSLDEHDRAVGSIQIAEGLLSGCVATARRLRGPDRPERWRAATSLGDDFREVWHHLDAARGVLAGRGINTMGYDELRAHVVTALPIDERDPMKPLDTAPLDDARRAVEELRLVVPGADWTAIAARTIALVNHAPLGNTSQHWKLAVVVAVFIAGVFTCVTAMKADPKIDPEVAMRADLASIVQARRHTISTLTALVGRHCDRSNVRELMKLFVMDGRFDDAREFGDAYERRCGDDVVVRKWSTAVRPHH